MTAYGPFASFTAFGGNPIVPVAPPPSSVDAFPDKEFSGKVAAIYKAIARKVAVKIAESTKDMTSKFPNIVVSRTT